MNYPDPSPIFRMVACYMAIFLPVVSIGAAQRLSTELQQDTLFLVVNQASDLDQRGLSLRGAVAEANQFAGLTEIQFDRRVFRKGHRMALDRGPLNIQPATRLIIRAPVGYLTLSGNHRNQLFTIASGAYLELHGLILSEGQTADGHYARPGGAINNRGTLVMQQCTVTNSRATGWLALGGGICNEGGTVVLDQSHLMGNAVSGESHTSAGGGLYSRGGRVVIRKGIIAGNRASGALSCYGAGLYCRGSILEISHTLVSGNQLLRGQDTLYGGGLYLENGEARLSYSTVYGNEIEGSSENFGAGIYNRSHLTLTHCVLEKNRIRAGQRNRGGGLYQSSGTARLTDCSLIDNEIRNGNQENEGRDIYSFQGDVRGSEVCFGENRKGKSDLNGPILMPEKTVAATGNYKKQTSYRASFVSKKHR